ncbi:MAG: SGNH/GDSL hydrolase family protein [Deltaproteobacteria bacterium]|nr:SGNH/GDSL hydrolase family protein [Deltaproteobacteria bacterium]
MDSDVRAVTPPGLRGVLFMALPSLLALGLIGAGVAWYLARPSAEERGRSLNREAWEASYRERAHTVPPQGPREGYWGARMAPKSKDPVLGWRDSAADVPGLLVIRENGTQELPCDGCETLLVSGGSVGFGAYASTIAKTWFGRLQAHQAEANEPVRVVVFAAGAWKSDQERYAIARALPHESPARVLMLTGLNDLTNGYRADLGYFDTVDSEGEPVPAGHSQDWDARVAFFVENVQATAELASQSGAEFSVVLQPALFEKSPLSAIEQDLLELSVAPFGGAAGIKTAYQRMADALTAAGLSPIDCRRPFDGEAATTFADVWHFGDRGHELLAGCVHRGLRE